MNNELIPSFKKSLFDTTIDIGVDLLELPIDLLTENEIIKDIPIVGTIVKLGKATTTIRDRHLIKKLVKFIESINNGDIESEKLERHKQILESDNKKLNEELENIIIIIDRQLEIDKTKILGELYKSYVCGNIDWEDFKSFSDVLERLFLYLENPALDVGFQNAYSYGGNKKTPSDIIKDAVWQLHFNIRRRTFR